MPALIVLLGLVVIAWFLATPVLLVSHLKLKSRFEQLNARLRRLEERLPGAPDTPDTQDIAARPNTAPQPERIRVPDASSPDSTQEPELPQVQESGLQPPARSPAPALEADAIEAPPRAFVFRRDKIEEGIAWLKENWVLAAGAGSLALAGVFLVQYGAERGLLTPFWRVMAALVFGSLLMTWGEYLRRRFGDDEGATQFLPSALSGAGIVTLFAAVLSARVLYDLIGPGQAFAGLAMVSAVGIVFGWFYGPVLTAVGILGATSAPYLVGGSSDTLWVLQYYFALIAIAALAIDTVKRWAWVSVLGLIATLASIWLIFVEAGFPQHFIIATLAVGAGAVMIPQRRLVPDHSGHPVAPLIWRAWPEFPTRLSFAATVNAAVAALAVATIGDTATDAYLALVVMVLLMGATTLWMWRAPALEDHAVIPVLSFLGLIAAQAWYNGPLYQSFVAGVSRPPETAPPATIWHLLVVAGIGTGLVFWRMPRAGQPLLWALAASSLAPFTVFLLEFLWDPASVLGTYVWAFAVIAVAAVMTLLASRSVHLKLEHSNLITSLFVVAAVSLIGLSLFLVLTKTALTLGLATMILFVAALDRKFDLPLLVYYSMIGAAVITFRLIVDPGLAWAVWGNVPLLQVLLAYGGTMLILAAACAVARSHRPRLSAILESTIWVLAAAFGFVLFDRLLPGRGLETHWGLGLLATLWLTMALAQLYRMQGGSTFERRLRWIIVAVLAVLIVATLGLRLAIFNPLQGGVVVGAPFVSTLTLAYVPLAVVLALAAWKFPGGLRPFLRIGLALAAVGYAFAYIGFSIRHFWRGPDLSVSGFTDPELYTYTLAMLIAASGTLIMAFWKRAVWLRKLALAGIALTIAKVFFIDMAGLSGLIRVLSFMGLGLALLALTWLDRIMSAQWENSKAE